MKSLGCAYSQANPDNRTIVLSISNANSLGVGSRIGVYEGDQLLLLGIVNITAVREVTTATT